MTVIKEALKRALAKFGVELKRLPNSDVRFENFLNLAEAFEHHCSSSINPISADDLRPKLLARLLGTPPTEAYFIVFALNQCKDIFGDVCEFGVAQGETSAFIANEIATLNAKKLHLFDSFEGLPTPTEKDQLKDDIFSLGCMAAYAGTMSCPEDMVLTRLKAISFPENRYEIHKGFIEQVIHSDRKLPRQVSFAYVDFDFYEPIKVALEFLHTTTSIGAKVVVDDYDFFSTGAKTAVDEFIKEKNADALRYECFVPNTVYGHFAILTRVN